MRQFGADTNGVVGIGGVMNWYVIIFAALALVAAVVAGVEWSRKRQLLALIESIREAVKDGKIESAEMADVIQKIYDLIRKEG